MAYAFLVHAYRSTCKCSKNYILKVREAKLIELQGDIDTSTITVTVFEASEFNRSTWQKINKNAISKLDFIEICRILQPAIRE